MPRNRNIHRSRIQNGGHRGQGWWGKDRVSGGEQENILEEGGSDGHMAPCMAVDWHAVHWKWLKGQVMPGSEEGGEEGVRAVALPGA